VQDNHCINKGYLDAVAMHKPGQRKVFHKASKTTCNFKIMYIIYICAD
jgi:hypothetical protein